MIYTCTRDTTFHIRKMEGQYIGETHLYQYSGNPLNGYMLIDSSYRDTFSIRLIENDSIEFIDGFYASRFKINNTNEYLIGQASLMKRSYIVIPPDSLKYSHSVSSRGSSTPNIYNRTFSGKKL